VCTQVTVEELPWATPFLSRRHGDAAKLAARDALTLVVSEVLTTFPHTILPNKLIQSLDQLADACGMALPLVNEVCVCVCVGWGWRGWGGGNTFCHVYLAVWLLCYLAVFPHRWQIAADIFDGRFTKKFLHSARIAAGLLKSSVYVFSAAVSASLLFRLVFHITSALHRMRPFRQVCGSLSAGGRFC
jgi:hypothetical protein